MTPASGRWGDGGLRSQSVGVDVESFALSGKTVVVTGAAQGLGRAIAEAMARCGAQLALCDRDGMSLTATAERIRAETAQRVETAVIDVRRGDEVRRFIDGIVSWCEAIDVLVNNAGGGFAAAFLDVNDKGQAALVDENFTSVTNFIRAAVPHMPPPDGERGGGGSIINITSIEAHRAGPGFAVYSAMKAAVANLTMSLALELGDRHVRVNAIAPDVIPTPGIGAIPVRTPLPYAGSPDDVAAAAVYLASDASAFVTGTTLHVDGGNRAAGGWRRSGDGAGFVT
jgi:3-oxoacyl-[acyl-carrier protein] reductase